eukprot:7181168-Pyramimonas_sp.AAC.1
MTGLLFSPPAHPDFYAHNDLLDEFGKARFGTPGPGEYNKPGAFGETVVFTTSSSYSFGIKPEGNNHPFISKQHSNAVGGNDSPGPAYNPNFKVVKKNQGKTVFTAADRDTEKLRYISQQHCKDNIAVSTPGPGTYRLKQGKGIAKTMGDAPAYKFSTDKQRGLLSERELLYHPGPGAHTLPGTYAFKDERHRNPAVDWAPQYSFAPHGEMERGLSRSRHESEVRDTYEQHIWGEISVRVFISRNNRGVTSIRIED